MAQTPSDDGGRAQRKLVEELQGRAKQARADLDVAETEGFTEQLNQLAADADAAEKDAGLIERDARGAAERLTLVRNEVAEAERQLLAPRTVSAVSPAVLALTVGFAVAAFVGALELVNLPAIDQPWFRAVAVAGGLVPPPILAWLWRRRLSGGGTFRTRS